jgi:hypothetical protein
MGDKTEFSCPDCLGALYYNKSSFEQYQPSVYVCHKCQKDFQPTYVRAFNKGLNHRPTQAEPNGPKRPSKIIVNCPKCFKSPCECKPSEGMENLELSRQNLDKSSRTPQPQGVKWPERRNLNLYKTVERTWESIGWNHCHDAFMSQMAKLPKLDGKRLRAFFSPYAYSSKNVKGYAIEDNEIDDLINAILNELNGKETK